MIVDDQVALSVQVMGKLRGTVMTSPTASQEEVETLARAQENVNKWLEGQKIKKVVYIAGRTINFVV